MDKYTIVTMTGDRALCISGAADEAGLEKEMGYQRANYPHYPDLYFEVTLVCENCAGRGELKKRKNDKSKFPMMMGCKVCKGTGGAKNVIGKEG